MVATKCLGVCSSLQWFVSKSITTLSPACYTCIAIECKCSHDTLLLLLLIHSQVCQWDEVVVDVENNLLSDFTSIHWHGIHQLGTPFMDGVPHLTQCPIEAGTTFRYDLVYLTPSFCVSSIDLQENTEPVFPSALLRYLTPSFCQHNLDEHIRETTGKLGYTGGF